MRKVRAGLSIESRNVGDICPSCYAPYREWRLTELHLLNGTTQPYTDPVVSLVCDCGMAKAEQLRLFEALA